MWEEAIILGKELAEQYENEMFDFEQLSASLVSHAMCFAKLEMSPIDIMHLKGHNSPKITILPIY